MQGTIRTFIRKGTCSQAFFYILDREFGQLNEEEEKASDPLAGGILQQGFQCGMLWGASLAVGAESYRRTKDPGQGVVLAITATQQILRSFNERTGTTECRKITGIDLTDRKSAMKYLLSGKFVRCFRLAGKWAPEAVKAAREGLEKQKNEHAQQALSCASEVVRKMGGNEEEIQMVAGFAGGLGLSGSGCGALAAALWMEALAHNREHEDMPASFDPAKSQTLKAFLGESGSEVMCSKICGKEFSKLEEHTEFLKKGGCKNLLSVLAPSPS